MSASVISSMISRVEQIADTVPSATSVEVLRSLGSQAMGTAIAIKESFSRLGIDTDSSAMRSLCGEYDYGDNLQTLKQNLQIVLHQVAGYYRGQLNNL